MGFSNASSCRCWTQTSWLPHPIAPFQDLWGQHLHLLWHVGMWVSVFTLGFLQQRESLKGMTWYLQAQWSGGLETTLGCNSILHLQETPSQKQLVTVTFSVCLPPTHPYFRWEHSDFLLGVHLFPTPSSWFVERGCPHLSKEHSLFPWPHWLALEGASDPGAQFLDFSRN